MGRGLSSNGADWSLLQVYRVPSNRVVKGTYPVTFKLRDFFQLTKREKIADLRRYASMRLKPIVSAQSKFFKTNAERREVFDKRKRKFFKAWPVCAVCWSARTRHIHHIIALANNGANGEKNLLGLCVQCHQKIHPWLRR